MKWPVSEAGADRLFGVNPKGGAGLKKTAGEISAVDLGLKKEDRMQARGTLRLLLAPKEDRTGRLAGDAGTARWDFCVLARSDGDELGVH